MEVLKRESSTRVKTEFSLANSELGLEITGRVLGRHCFWMFWVGGYRGGQNEKGKNGQDIQ